nr:GW dipeptide domain-containing protein [Clostridiales bacterium]
MKKLRFISILILLLMFHIVCNSQEIESNVYNQIKVTVKKNTAVYAKPNTFGEKKGNVSKGDVFELYDINKNMYKIRTADGKYAWIGAAAVDIPLVENDVRVTGKLFVEPSRKAESVIELRSNVSAMLLESDGQWYKVRLSDGREGWTKKVRTVPQSVAYSQRGARLTDTPGKSSANSVWMDAGKQYVTLKRDGDYYLISDGTHTGWMKNPHLPPALVTKDKIKLCLNDDIRKQNGPELEQGVKVEPLDYFHKIYMVRMQDGTVAFQHRDGFAAFEPEILPVAKEVSLYSERDDDSEVIGKVPAMSNMPIIKKDDDWAQVDNGNGQSGWIYLEDAEMADDGWMYVAVDGVLLDDPDWEAEAVDSVKAGQRFEKGMICGQFYEAEMEDGREGWLQTHVVKPTPFEKAVMLRNNKMSSGTANQEGKHSNVGEAKKWDEVTQIEKIEDFVKIRTKDGKVGWVRQRDVRPEGQVEPGAIAFIYHIMWKFYEHNHTTSIFGEILYMLLFLLFFSVPYIVSYYAAKRIAYIKVLPNFIVKVVGSVVILFLAVILVGNLHWPNAYPPFRFYPNLTTATHLIFGLAAVMNFLHLIYRHRC